MSASNCDDIKNKINENIDSNFDNFNENDVYCFNDYDIDEDAANIVNQFYYINENCKSLNKTSLKNYHSPETTAAVNLAATNLATNIKSSEINDFEFEINQEQENLFPCKINILDINEIKEERPPNSKSIYDNINEIVDNFSNTNTNISNAEFDLRNLNNSVSFRSIESSLSSQFNTDLLNVPNFLMIDESDLSTNENKQKTKEKDFNLTNNFDSDSSSISNTFTTIDEEVSKISSESTKSSLLNLKLDKMELKLEIEQEKTL